MTGAILFDGHTAAARPVTAGIVGNALEIRDEAGVLLQSWPLKRVSRTDPDAPGEAATLRCADRIERLVTTEGEVIRAVQESGSRLGRGGLTKTAIVFGAALLAAAGVAIALLVDRLPNLIAPLIPPQVERTWSDAIEGVLAAGHHRCRTADGETALSGLLTRLSAAASLAKPPGFLVLDDNQVNAFTLPDGRIIVLRGLLQAAADPDEFAGVLAHELGHVRHGDPTREALRAAGLGLLAQGIGWGGSLAGHMTTLSYGRKAEAAADRSAIETLQAAGLRADGLSRFLTRQHDNAMPAFLSDHPGNASRAEALRVAPTGTTALDPESWTALKGMCRADPDLARLNRI